MDDLKFKLLIKTDATDNDDIMMIIDVMRKCGRGISITKMKQYQDHCERVTRHLHGDSLLNRAVAEKAGR